MLLSILLLQLCRLWRAVLELEVCIVKFLHWLTALLLLLPLLPVLLQPCQHSID